MDFNELIDRRNTASYKWDVGEGELPMWVADMDFRVAQCIFLALLKRTIHSVFGYNTVPDEWYDAYIRFWKKRHRFEMKREWLFFSTGVVPTISSAVRSLTGEGEGVIILTPVYNIFFNSIVNNHRTVVECPLLYSEGEFSIDWKALKEKMRDKNNTLMIFCNPHNPCGNIWSRRELKRLGHMAAEYGVTVISDEIHCDITEPGHSYIPFASVSEECAAVSVTCIAPTKCFNIAGMQTSAVCICDEALKKKVERGLNTDECAEPNSFAVPVTVAAFNEGVDWLNAMNKYVAENKELVRGFFEKYLPDVIISRGYATYLLWMDFSKLSDDTTLLCDDIRKKTGLILSPGAIFGADGKHFIRMNVAAPRSVVLDGLDRIARYFGINTQK